MAGNGGTLADGARVGRLETVDFPLMAAKCRLAQDCPAGRGRSRRTAREGEVLGVIVVVDRQQVLVVAVAADQVEVEMRQLSAGDLRNEARNPADTGSSIPSG